MKQRTLKEVAQAGLVLGFEWIAKDGNTGALNIYTWEPKWNDRLGAWWHGGFYTLVRVSDFPDLPPEKSLLKLSEIVEGE